MARGRGDEVVLHEITPPSPCHGHGVEFAEVMLDLPKTVGLQAGLVYVILLDKEGITIGRRECLI